MEGTKHWLDRYGSSVYQWQDIWVRGRRRFYRPLGLVEFAFDADGVYHEGRADMCSELEVEMRSSLSSRTLRERILLAWTCLRCQHLMLQTRAITKSKLSSATASSETDRCFAIDAPSTPEQALFDTTQHVTFLDDHFEAVDSVDFWIHTQNAARVLDPVKCLSRTFVHRPEKLSNGRMRMRFLMIAAHCIVDGLSNYIWMRDLVHLLNLSAPDLRTTLDGLIEVEAFRTRLPLPQEALYPPVSGSPARRQWYWLLTRILRHVRRPLRAGFPNPLQRSTPQRPIPLSPTYAAVLDYSMTPPLNTMPCFFKVNLQNTQRLHRLCKDASASIGAGCFALTAVSMMELYEKCQPDVELADRKPFIAGFPLDPRAFFNHHTEPDSLMLAFCDGITLPFLPSSLSVDGRLRLLARQAHRQLASYQKRPRIASDDAKIQHMSSRGAGRVLANQYVMSVERADSILPEHLRTGIDPQGAYRRGANESLQTCGVSSVGRRDALIKQGMYDLGDESKDLAVDFRNVLANVRARGGEFLIGIGGSSEGLWVNASIDASTMDPALVDLWRERFEHMLDNFDGQQKAKL